MDQFKTYHLVPKWRIFYGLVGAFWIIYLGYQISMLLKALFLSEDASTHVDYFSIIFHSTYAVIFALYTLSEVFYTRLTLSPEGIEFHTTGGYVRARWDEVTRAGEKWGFPWYWFKGVFVAPSFTPPRFLRLFGKEQFLPLALFQKDWQDAELGKIVQQHAPSIFEIDWIKSTNRNN